MSALELKVYELFKKRFGEDEATTVIEYFEEKADRKFAEKKDVLATKEDIAALSTATKEDIAALSTATKEDIAALKVATKEDIAALKMATKEDIAALRVATQGDIAALRIEMKEQKSDILKWVFAFFMTLALMIAGLYLKK